jgi:hypothetical protein
LRAAGGKLDDSLRENQRNGRRFARRLYVAPEGATHKDASNAARRRFMSRLKL